MQRVYYHEGETVGSVIIVEQRSFDTPFMTTEYLVRRICCGKHEILTHDKIRRKKDKRTVMCDDCKRALGFTRYQKEDVKPKVHVPIFVPGWGDITKLSLGPLGPRGGY